MFRKSLAFFCLSSLISMVMAGTALSITNGDFETGDLTGWTASAIGATIPPEPKTPLISVFTVEGNNFAGFEAGAFESGPFISTLEQTFIVPSLNPILSFDFSFLTLPDPTGAAQSPFLDAFTVTVQDGTDFFDFLLVDAAGPIIDPFGTAPGGAALQTPSDSFFSFRFSADLSSLAGHTVTLFFDMISEDNGLNLKVDLDNVVAAANQPPEAVCNDVTIATDPGDCTALPDPAHLAAQVGAGSSDPNGDPITLSVSPPGPYSLGENAVTLTVTDDQSASAECTAAVTVVDQEPPIINNLTANPNELWPPNHKMTPVTVDVDTSDNCDPDPVCQIILVESNEPENGLGDGDTAPDSEITGDLTTDLRSERSGTGNGRQYTITVECTDSTGNTATANTIVTVPHDKGE